jgi:2-phospho-L-lactate guanylyltransferase
MNEQGLPGFAVLVPIKPVPVAKSRLAPLGDDIRRALVTALAEDTVRAALSSSLVSTVLLVTDDHRLASRLRPLGVDVLPDGADDLNESLVEAAAEVRRRHPAVSVAALCADLPALRHRELTAALREAAGHEGAFVADAAGSGTTLVTARGEATFRPRFGLGSRDAHVAVGLHEIDAVDVPTLRRDVDTPGDLGDAGVLGVGESTAAVLARHRL